MKFDRPPWQEGITIASVNPGAIVGRCVPDVAANADWNASPYLLVMDGKAQGNGGTGAASPLWAWLVTLINQARGPGKRIGYLTPLLSQGGVGSAGCADITSGDNVTATVGGYSAGPGYDTVSGWGTPNGKQCWLLYPLNLKVARLVRSRAAGREHLPGQLVLET